ncbi:DUF397 domain-containing protein [Streptomyces sp. 6N223]|uniref:DUF397 domain-containing protein n=1 Tax=Streptomyces sp. 6N223 TaxID=3457412 RepID=UPI003FD2BAE5
MNTEQSELRATQSDGVWVKSSYSNGSGPDCVEILRIAGAVAVRDSKNATGPRLSVPEAAWAAFLAEVR